METARHPAGPPITAADHRMVDALAQLTFAIQQVLTEVAGDADLTVPQLRLLGIVRDRTVAMNELARYLGLDKSSITGLVGRAEKRGLLGREPRPDDGRGVQVRITPLGLDVAVTLGRQLAARLLGLTERLDAAERRQLTTLVEAVVGVTA